MLVLSRKIKESITLQAQEGTITISIKNIKGQQVKIGIDAPWSINVARTELLEALGAE